MFLALEGRTCTHFPWQSLVRAFSTSVTTSPFHKPVPTYASLPEAFSVLGGGGNLGSSLVDYLLEAGAKSVKVLDIKPYRGKFANDARVRSIVGSVCDRSKVDEAVAGSNTVVSAITPNIPTASWNQFVAINVHGTQTALNAASLAGVKAFVHVSSIAVNNHYIEHDNQPDTAPLPDLEAYSSPYDLTKRLSEDLALQANGAMRTVALRPGGILMGPKDYALQGIFDHGITYFEGKPIDFTYGRNVCHAILLAAANLQDPGSKAAGRAMTVSKGKAINMGELSRDLGVRLKKNIKVLPGIISSAVSLGSVITHAIRNERAHNVAPGIPTHRFLTMANYTQTFDNALARQLLGFEPVYSYEETLDAIAQEYFLNVKAGK